MAETCWNEGPGTGKSPGSPSWPWPQMQPLPPRRSFAVPAGHVWRHSRQLVGAWWAWQTWTSYWPHWDWIFLDHFGTLIWWIWWNMMNYILYCAITPGKMRRLKFLETWCILKHVWVPPSLMLIRSHAEEAPTCQKVAGPTWAAMDPNFCWVMISSSAFIQW